MINPLELTGKTVLVTGASSGIGRDVALLLSQLGARVILSARNRERLNGTMALLEGASHVIEAFDLTDVAEIPAWLQELATRTGPLYGLVHCAGIASRLPVRFMSLEQAEATMRTNWLSAWALAKGFRHKRVFSGTDGRIVFISSILALAGQSGAAAYASSKGAILSLTRALALEFASENIRVNAVLPGLVQTEMADALGQELTVEQIQFIVAKHPLGLGKPRDVAYAIAFLLAETSRWITGSVLTVDGGYTAQ